MLLVVCNREERYTASLTTRSNVNDLTYKNIIPKTKLTTSTTVLQDNNMTPTRGLGFVEEHGNWNLVLRQLGKCFQKIFTLRNIYSKTSCKHASIYGTSTRRFEALSSLVLGSQMALHGLLGRVFLLKLKMQYSSDYEIQSSSIHQSGEQLSSPYSR